MKSEIKPIAKGSELAILDIGLVTSLATGWRESCAAMRAGYDAFVQPENSLHPIAEVPFNPNIRGFTRLARLLELAMNDLANDHSGIPVLFALPERNRVGLESYGDSHQKIFDAMVKIPCFQGKFIRGQLECFAQGRTSLAHQLMRAQEILTQTSYDKVMIMAVDSWLFPQTLNALLATHWDRDPVLDKRRLLTSGNGEDNTDGFIPAEAAGVLVVSRAEKHHLAYRIDGVANAFEPIPLMSTQVSRAEGLSDAIRQACALAESPFMAYPLRIASVSGEQYYFREASLAQTRNLTSRVTRQPLWHPASHIGETGCVVGIAMLAMAMNSFDFHCIQGDRVLCHMSNDENDRAAISVTYHMEKQTDDSQGE